MSGTVSIKEFLELKIAYEAAEIKHVKEIMAEREIALKIQAKEYERRLEDLNGEAGRLRLMQGTYIPREVYDTEIRQLKKENVENKEWRANREGRESKAVWISIIALIFSVILALIKYIP